MCIGIENHHEQHNAYLERKVILENQKVIANHLAMIEQKLEGKKPQAPNVQHAPSIPYERWNTKNVPWGALDEALGRGGKGKEPEVPKECEESEGDDDDDDEDGDDDDKESEEGNDDDDSREE